MELNKAFEFAAILAWEDLVKVTEPCSVRVEYRAEPGNPLDYVSVWSAKAEGYQYLVCDYWTWTAPAHPSGVRFRNGYSSDQLAQTLYFIMKNQDQFTRRADACRDGLVLIDSPTKAERTEAAAWIRAVRGTATNFGCAADVKVLPMPSVARRTPESELPSVSTGAGSITPPRLAECDRAESAVVSG
jgi:hypothetical protein